MNIVYLHTPDCERVVGTFIDLSFKFGVDFKGKINISGNSYLDYLVNIPSDGEILHQKVSDPAYEMMLLNMIYDWIQNFYK